MLTRYKIYRGRRPAHDPLPEGIRQDTRKHTQHCLRPDAAAVTAYLANPDPSTWQAFAEEYRRLLQRRHAGDPTPFAALAELAQRDDVYIGCSCPTAKNPNVSQCHTVLALEFMRENYPELTVKIP